MSKPPIGSDAQLAHLNASQKWTIMCAYTYQPSKIARLPFSQRQTTLISCCHLASSFVSQRFNVVTRGKRAVFARVALTLTRWPWYRNLSCTLERYIMQTKLSHTSIHPERPTPAKTLQVTGNFHIGVKQSELLPLWHGAHSCIP